MSPASSAAIPLPTLKGETYDQARSKMIKLGFKPVRFLRTEDACLFDESCKRYPELLTCGPTAPAHCKFVFINAARRTYVVITTFGKTRRVQSIATASRRESSGWPRFVRP